MKVIKHGKLYEKTSRRCCRNCGCEYEFTANDCSYKTIVKDTNGPFSALVVCCPECGNLSVVSEYDFDD